MPNNKSHNSSSWANPTFYAALLAALLSILNLYVQDSYRQSDLKLSAERELLQQRKEALLSALEVIDYVYANENFGDIKKPLKHPWPIQKARDAMNKMIIYCEDPKTTVVMFREVVGMYNPLMEKPKATRRYDIQDFRRQVARELHLPEVNFSDPNYIWISHMPGAQ